MKLLIGRDRSKQLHTLNEREVQERLYGSYHRGNAPLPRTQEPPALTPKIEFHPETRIPDFSDWFRSIWERTQPPVVQFLRSFPWMFAGGVVSALLVAVLLFQIISSVFSNLRFSSSTSREERTAGIIATPIASTDQEMPPVEDVPAAASEFSGVQSSVPPAPERVSPETSAAKKKFYSVQVFTSHRERDAKRLTEELKQRNFAAFYERMPSQERGLSFYVVFLGRQNSYADAKADLGRFQKADIFSDFTDSFIRSL